MIQTFTLPSEEGKGKDNRAIRPWLRILVLGVVLLISIITNLVLNSVVPANDTQIGPFLNVWLVSFLPYFAGCVYVLATPATTGRWNKVELGFILLGAFVLRAMLLPIPPVLSRDSWRYLWDARVTLHGFSPYVTIPVDPAVSFLKDNVLFPNMRFRTAPTIYPPGAQLVFLLSYLLAQTNLFFLKGIFLVFDMLNCVLLMVMLKRWGLDQRRVLLYAWCPLPIVEFAIQGHVDVITVTFVLLALFVADRSGLRWRALTGILIGLAALTKIYPILLLAIVVPDLLREALVDGRLALSAVPRLLKSGSALLLPCFATALLGYLPYLIVGHGQVLGYFSTYFSEQGQNAGTIQLLVVWVVGTRLHYSSRVFIPIEHDVALALVIIVTLLVFLFRLRDRLRRESATLLLFGAVLSVSSHVFPWYLAIMLIWVPILLEAPWKRGKGGGVSGKGLAILTIWYFTFASLLGYYTFQGGPFPDWSIYYYIVYIPVMLLLGLSALIGISNNSWLLKGISRANNT